jgi:uncharacterized membrane protein
MEACLVVVLLWLLFAGTHMGLSAPRIRGALVARLGEGGFRALFSVVAAVSFTFLVTYYVGHRFQGPPGPALGAFAPLRWLLMGVIGAGFALVAGGLAVYPRSPMALFSGREARAPRGFERITRHGFFAGLVLFAVAHGLLATRLVGVLFCLGLALLPILGARHQDARLLAERGAVYADYLAATSALPFAAVLDGRQRIVWSELPWIWLAGGALAAPVLRQLHTPLLAHGGAWVVAAVLGGAALASYQAWRRGLRRRSAARDLVRGAS